jgi:hypothetical protein
MLKQTRIGTSKMWHGWRGKTVRRGNPIKCLLARPAFIKNFGAAHE